MIKVFLTVKTKNMFFCYHCCKAIASADQSLQDETKSSAGDKYETSREMIQQDLNRYQQQLAVAQQDRAALEKLDLTPAKHVSTGGLVKTDTAVYFVASSVGLVKLEGVSVFVISPKSPIGQLLLGKSVG